MVRTIKVLANTVTIGTSNTDVGKARVLRLLNANTSASRLITISDPVANAQVGSLQLLPNSEATIEKRSTYVIAANDAAGVTGVSIGFTN
jgi:hypothetical protein